MKQKNLIIFPFLLVFYEIAGYLSNDMYLPALPDMMRDLGLTTQQAQLTLTTWFLGSASIPLFAGIAADRFGRRPILLIGGFIYILTTCICAITSDIHTLLITRYIEGSMVPTIIVAGYACIHESYDHAAAIRLLALMSSITVLAPALGPLFGSIVLTILNWRGIFWIIALWATCGIVLLMRWMPETLPAENRQALHLGQLGSTYWSIITNKQFILLSCVLGFVFAGFIAWITAGPLLVISTFHYSAIAFGLIQALVFTAYIFGNHLVKYLLVWLGAPKMIRLGLVVSLVGGVWMLGFAFLLPHTLTTFLIGMITYSLGSAFCFSPLNRAIIESSTAPMGARMAMFTVLITIFSALGSGMASAVFNGTILSLSALIAFCIALACLLKGIHIRSK